MSDKKPQTRQAIVKPLARNPETGAMKVLIHEERGTYLADTIPAEQCENPDELERVRCVSRKDGSGLFDATITPAKSAAARRNHKAYAEGWDRIFGKKEPAEA